MNHHMHALIQKGIVVATIQWHTPTDAAVYALDGVDSSNLREVPLAELTDIGGLITDLEGCYRIDDRRPGQNHSYMVWNGSSDPGLPVLASFEVYHFVDDEPSETESLTEFTDVWALMDEPDTLVVRDVQGFAHRHTDDPDVRAAFELEGRVSAWDLGAIYRSQRTAA